MSITTTQQATLDLLKDTNPAFLTEVTEDSFLKAMEEGKAGENAKAANPAPVEAPEKIFETSNPLPGGPQQPTGQNNVNMGAVLSGEVAVGLFDNIAPVLFSIALRKFTDINVNKSAFKLTAAEKSQLTPLVDRVLAEVNINFENPFIALGVSIAFIYGSKTIEVMNSPEAEQSKKKPQPRQEGSNPAPVSTRKPGETRGRKPKNFVS